MRSLTVAALSCGMIPLGYLVPASTMAATHPPDPCVVHPLPPAPKFVGRETELDELRRLWHSGFRGVCALVGLGGAGKTAVAARFLEELLGTQGIPLPEGLFVWSFYQEPDAGLFLQEAYRYFCRADSVGTPAKGAGLLHLLREAIAVGGPHLLVLDGLERVQRPGDSGTDVYGQLEDPLLKGLLTRIAEGSGNTTVLVTSRFSLTDLKPYQGRGYRHLDISGLGGAAALALLRSHGVKGDDATLEELIETYGAHPLTLDHLGGLLVQFLGAEPQRAPEVPLLAAPATDRQALRLARLLKAYEEHLPPEELTLLCRFCSLRRSVSEAQIIQLFLCSPTVHSRTARVLGDRIARLPGRGGYPEQLQCDLAESIQATIAAALCTAPLAGPEDAFQQEILTAMEQAFQPQEAPSESDFASLARLYAGTDQALPSDQLPLPAEDRELLRACFTRYNELLEHPLAPSKDPPPALEVKFQLLGYPPKKSPKHPREDVSSLDIEHAFRNVQQRLRFLVSKHFTLRRVRELCRFYQRKWSLAGALAPLDAAALRKLLDSLVERHLALREADGSFSLANDGVARLRPLQALPQVRHRLGAPAQPLVGPAQVKEDKRIVGVLGLVQLQEAQVALELAAFQGRVLVAGVLDDDVGPADVGPQPPQRRQALLVHPVLPAHVRMVAEEPHVIDIHGRADALVRPGARLHDVGGVFVFEAGEQLAQLLAVFFVEPVIGVEPEDPVPRGVSQALIAGAGEVVAPGEVEDAGAEGGGDFLGAVGRAGVDDDDFVDEVGRRSTSGRDAMFAE